MTHTELEWRTADGLRLYAQEWRPDAQVRAVVCVLHGLGEHSGRYAHVAAVLAQAGYAFLGPDLRGHGRSEGQRGHAPSWDVLLDDVAVLIREAGGRCPGAPCFLYGHSLGASLALSYVLRRKAQGAADLAGVIATGPILRTAFAPPAWKIALGHVLYGLWPTFSMTNEVDPNGLSHDPQVARAYLADPLVHNRVSARLGIGFLNEGEWLLAHAAEFPLPLLLMVGGADPITSAQASQEFAARVPADCTFKRWDGLYHEIHNEPQQGEVLAFLVFWLQAHTAP